MKFTTATAAFISSILATDGALASPITGEKADFLSTADILNVKRQEGGGINYGKPSCDRIIFLLNIPCLGLWGGFCNAEGFQTTVFEEVTKPVCELFCRCPAPVPVPASGSGPA
ncbi:hypothetical protein QBC40DRAFT_256144 [Triangularia verruculosa]|uniref:Uncharacterized protein n=1 Tax=Triangularia verruculosa TaxID=2587418 RepID=A0AAN6XF45_9PEZI|nr:hypothetical protein QBC40DRAFT_256144 [Triangularia verruculosa]